MLKLKTAPTSEPVSLAELKEFLRLESGSYADNNESVQTIAPGAHAVVGGFGLVGSSVGVSGVASVVFLEAGTCGGGGSVTVKIQDSENGGTWSDVVGGAFTVITEANDNATYEKAYEGGKAYLRAVATVAGATCEFGVSILKILPVTAEDSLLSTLLRTARLYCESYQARAFVTQTWEWWLDDWPKSPIDVPLPPLRVVNSVKYYGTDDAEYTWSTSEYMVDTVSSPGRVCLKDGRSYPSVSLRPIQGVVVDFDAGYGVAADIPDSTRTAIKLLAAHFFENREATTDRSLTQVPLGIRALLDLDRIFV